jgi:hypothetical protein
MPILSLLVWGGAAVLVIPVLVLVFLRVRHLVQFMWAWRSLRVPAGREVFSEALVADLPPRVQRYFLRAIKPGARLPVSATMRIGAWAKFSLSDPGHAFEERRILTPFRGGVWMTRSFTKRLREISDAFYADGLGVERGTAYWLIPIIFTLYSVPDITRLFKRRMIAESALVPSALLPQRGVCWEMLDESNARATITCAGETVPLTLRIDPDGRLCEVMFDHWNVKGTGGVWRDIPSALVMHRERSFGDYTMPDDYTMILWYNTSEREQGATLRYTISEATFT